MAKSKAEVELVISQKAAAQAFQELANKATEAVKKLEDQTEKANKKGKEAGDQMGKWPEFITRAARNLTGFVTGLLSARTVVSVVRAEFEQLVRLQDEAKDKRFAFVSRMRELREIFPTRAELTTLPEAQRVDADEAEKLAQASIDPLGAIELIQAMNSAALTSKRDAFEVSRFLIQQKPHLLRGGIAKDIGTAMVSMRELGVFKSGTSMEAMFEMVNRAASLARTETVGQFSKSLPAGFAAMVQNQGFDARSSMAFGAAMTSLGVDPQGDQTRTMLTKVFPQIQRAISSRGIFKDGRQLQGMDLIDFITGRGEFEGKFENERREARALLMGLDVPGAGQAEFQETQALLEEMKGKPLNQAVLAAGKAQLEGRSHLKAIMIGMLTPGHPFEQVFRDVYESMPDEQRAAALSQIRQSEGRADIGFDAGVAFRQFESQATLDPQRAARGQAAEIIRRGLELSGAGALRTKLTGTIERLQASGATDIDAIKAARETLGGELDFLKFGKKAIGPRGGSISVGSRPEDSEAIRLLAELVDRLDRLITMSEQQRAEGTKVSNLPRDNGAPIQPPSAHHFLPIDLLPARGGA